MLTYYTKVLATPSLIENHIIQLSFCQFINPLFIGNSRDYKKMKKDLTDYIYSHLVLYSIFN